MKKTVAVGLSGGIDSATTALLLLKEGFNVIGVTMSIWDESSPYKPLKKGCYGPIDEKRIKEAKRLASIIGIEHTVIDLKNEFKDYVLDYFFREYNMGKTPNPCIVCNSLVKFGSLIEKMKKEGISFDFFATGHYVRKLFDQKEGRYILKRGIDRSKDQSYFLYRLSQKQLEQILFPLGDYTKEEVKRIAVESGLGYLAKKPESQDFGRFEIYGTEKKYGPGNIIDINGRIIGMHEGIHQYTIGQRKGLNLAGLKVPYYVIKINPERNEIIAGPKENLLAKTLIAYDTNWFFSFEEIVNKPVFAQIRYKSKASMCNIYPMEDNKYSVIFHEPQEAITPGQSVVFYNNEILLGGGIIQ